MLRPNIKEYSVFEVSKLIKRLIEDNLGYVKIRGEVIGFKKASSGHCYFSLKDENALISAVCFRNAISQINFKIEDGMEVCASGKVTTYEGRSNYQIIVQKIEIAGEGALIKMIEERRQKLLKEGLFEEKYKQKLPFWPDKIGVITSKTGAVIKDIIHRVKQRFPTNIKLYPAAMQGQNSALEIITAIKYFNSLNNDLAPNIIIIARGGGSLEDLLPFNDEELVRAIFDSKIPIISAIGHETDNSLIDYVSDIRAPTPSAAAEIVTPTLSDLKQIILNLESRLNNYISNFVKIKERDLINISKNLLHPNKILEKYQEHIKNLDKRMELLLKTNLLQKENSLEIAYKSLIKPDQILNNYQDKINSLFEKLDNNFNYKINNLNNKINLADKLLESYHYKKVLKRGYAIIRNKNQDIIGNIKKITQNQDINIELNGGKINAITK